MKKFRSIITALLTLCIVQGVWAVAPGGALGGGGKAAQSQPSQEGKIVAQPAQPLLIDPAEDQIGVEAEAPIVNTTPTKTSADTQKSGKEAQSNQEANELDYNKAVVAHNSKKEMRHQLKDSLRKYRENQKHQDSPASPMDDMLILCVILAFFIPPLAVFLYLGSITTEFWISLILTLLFFVPGVIYSLIVILTN